MRRQRLQWHHRGYLTHDFRIHDHCTVPHAKLQLEFQPEFQPELWHRD